MEGGKSVKALSLEMAAMASQQAKEEEAWEEEVLGLLQTNEATRALVQRVQRRQLARLTQDCLETELTKYEAIHRGTVARLQHMDEKALALAVGTGVGALNIAGMAGYGVSGLAMGVQAAGGVAKTTLRFAKDRKARIRAEKAVILVTGPEGRLLTDVTRHIADIVSRRFQAQAAQVTWSSLLNMAAGFSRLLFNTVLNKPKTELRAMLQGSSSGGHLDPTSGVAARVRVHGRERLLAGIDLLVLEALATPFEGVSTLPLRINLTALRIEQAGNKKSGEAGEKKLICSVLDLVTGTFLVGSQGDSFVPPRSIALVRKAQACRSFPLAVSCLPSLRKFENELEHVAQLTGQVAMAGRKEDWTPPDIDPRKEREEADKRKAAAKAMVERIVQTLSVPKMVKAHRGRMGKGGQNSGGEDALDGDSLFSASSLVSVVDLVTRATVAVESGKDLLAAEELMSAETMTDAATFVGAVCGWAPLMGAAEVVLPLFE